MPIPNNLSKRQQLQARFKGSRNNLLLVVAFTVINTILLVTKSDTYFLFSAYIPYVLVFLGMSVCGMLPAEYYGEEFSQMEFVPSSAFAVFLAIAVVIIALYFLAWLFSKKNRPTTAKGCKGYHCGSWIWFFKDDIAKLSSTE
jgi:hypothetical protein